MMYKTLLKMLFVVAAISPLTAVAELLDKEALPAPVLEQLYKRHPNAATITALAVKHFNQDLFQVNFKDGEDKLTEYYRTNGHFFVNAPEIDPSGLLPPGTLENIKAEFPNHEIKQALQIANPNGPGEAFDFSLDVTGARWAVSVDGDGKITGKERF